jgi:hypothetical protein
MLAVLSPLTAEFLLGDQYLAGMQPVGQQVAMFVVFVAFYGMAAVLIRELGRRLRVGWTGLLLLALGFGIFEEGLITQSLFNPHYLGLSLTAPGHLPGIGMGAPWTVFVLSLHVIWSMAAPIAIIEAWYGRGGAAGSEPWLGRAGVIICTVIFVVAAAAVAIFSVLSDAHHYVASPLQLIGAALAAAVAVFAAVQLRGRDHRTPGKAGLRPAILSAVLGLLATTAIQAGAQLRVPAPWLSTAAVLLTWLLSIVIMVRWDRAGSGPVPFGLAAGALITYCWVGLLPALRVGAGGLVEQLVLIILVLALLVWTARRSLAFDVPQVRQGISTVQP